jgi:hypothetical protein
VKDKNNAADAGLLDLERKRWRPEYRSISQPWSGVGT